MAEACAAPRDRLQGIFPGSWIDSNFYIWIGHADDQRAWSQVADARQALDEASEDLDARTLAQARQEMFIAEGSDWCWWYGDDHSSEHDVEFDELFRRHLRNVYRLLGRPIPDELFVSNITTGATPLHITAPTALISPVLDGEESSYFEWLCAGALEVRSVAGAMHQVERQDVVSQVRFGFSGSSLFLRIDGARTAADLLGDGWSVIVNFLRPSGLRVAISRTPEGVVGAFLSRRDGATWQPVTDGSQAQAAAGTILECRIPLALLGTERLDELSFFVTINDANQVEIERHPAGRPIELSVPDERFAAVNWSA